MDEYEDDREELEDWRREQYEEADSWMDWSDEMNSDDEVCE